MSVMIQIRNVPDEIHRILKSRAAEAGMSLSDYLLKDVTRMAERPTMRQWLESLKTMKPIKTRETSAETIRAMRSER